MGSSSFRETLEITERMVARIRQCFPELVATGGLRSRLDSPQDPPKIMLSTDYSGIGCFEMGGSMMLEAVSKVLGDDSAKLAGKVASYRACDLDADCRRVLLSHQGPLAPRH
eukprot:14144013-Alexandrium_andersonii.AAC.1